MVTANQLQILQSPITGLISSVSTSVTVKLDETNYLQWHFQMQLMLEVHGLIGFVDGSNLCLAQFSSTSSGDSEVTSGTSCSRIENDEYKVWKMHDHSLMLLITTTLSSSAISCVIGSKSSQEMWVRLQNQFFFPSTKTSIIKLQTDLYNIKKGLNSISQYLQRIKEARDGLSILGVTFADEDFVIIALNGLPPKYNTFKCVLRGRESIISLKDFRAQLLAEEAIVDCALVECETKGSFFPLFSSQFHAGFNGGYHAQSNFSSCQSSYGNNVDSYNGILGSPPSPYPSSLPPEITTCQICSHKDHLAAQCSAQTTNSSITQDPNLQDQVRFSVSMESIETDSAMVNSFSHYLGSSLPLNSTTRASISASKHKDHDEMFLDDAEKQVLECIDKESANSQLISVGLQSCIQVTFPIINSSNKVKIGVPTQTVVHEFRGFYILRLCNGGSIFDTQLGYHVRISDKGGGLMFLFRSIYLGCTLRMNSSFLIAGLLSWLLQFELEFLIAIIRLLVQLVGRIQSIFYDISKSVLMMVICQEASWLSDVAGDMNFSQSLTPILVNSATSIGRWSATELLNRCEQLLSPSSTS